MPSRPTLRHKIESYIRLGWENRFWYESSNASATRFCVEYELNVNTFLSYVAILSPRVHVTKNISFAKQYALGKNTTGMMKQRVNALQLFDVSGVVSGVKINAFLDSLLLRPGAVCIDIWMSRIFGFDKGELMLSTKLWQRKRNYYQNYVRRVASEFNLESYQMQAVLWSGYRQANTITDAAVQPMGF